MRLRSPTSEAVVHLRPAAGWRAVLCFISKGFALLLSAYLPAVAIFVLVPELNDYAKASVLKHRRLSETSGRRIILIGGSNLAFGIDSPIIEEATGCPVVNMGMNGYLGVRFMLEEARPNLHRDDVVVVALEYDSYYKSPQGTALDQLMILKANPRAFEYLNWRQRQAVARVVPYVAQQKILRLIRDTKNSAFSIHVERSTDPAEESSVDINVIESVSGFTDRGDLVSHLGVEWPRRREDGVDMTHMPLDVEIVPLLQSFTDEMRKSGISVLLSYTPVIADYYRRHQLAVEELHDLLAQSPPLVVPSPPSTFVYDASLFFDTVYHLNAEGRRLRSERVAKDIQRAFSAERLCSDRGVSVTIR